jgi:DNA-damage-inducible protein D
MLGEASTTEIARSEDAQGFVKNKGVAQRGDAVAGKAREQLEMETEKKIVSKENYLAETDTQNEIE